MISKNSIFKGSSKGVRYFEPLPSNDEEDIWADISEESEDDSEDPDPEKVWESDESDTEEEPPKAKPANPPVEKENKIPESEKLKEPENPQVQPQVQQSQELPPQIPLQGLKDPENTQDQLHRPPTQSPRKNVRQRLAKYRYAGNTRADVIADITSELSSFRRHHTVQRLAAAVSTSIAGGQDASGPWSRVKVEKDPDDTEIAGDEMDEQVIDLGLLLSNPSAYESESESESEEEEDSEWESDPEPDSDSDEDEDPLASLKTSNNADKTSLKRTIRGKVHPLTRDWVKKVYRDNQLTDKELDKKKSSLKQDLTPTFSSVSEFLYALQFLGDERIPNPPLPETEVEPSQWVGLLRESPWAPHFTSQLAETLFRVARTRKMKKLSLMDLCQLYCWLGVEKLYKTFELPLSEASSTTQISAPPLNHVIPFLAYLFELSSSVWMPSFQGVVSQAEAKKGGNCVYYFPQGQTFEVEDKFYHTYRNLAYLETDEKGKDTSSVFLVWDSVKKMIVKREKPKSGRSRYRYDSGKVTFEVDKKTAEQLIAFYGMQGAVVEVTPENWLGPPIEDNSLNDSPPSEEKPAEVESGNSESNPDDLY